MTRAGSKALLALCLLLAALAGTLGRDAALGVLEKAAVLHSLGSSGARLGARDLREPDWDSGWRQVCEPGNGPLVFVPRSVSAGRIGAMAAFNVGDFLVARQLLAREQ